jgi:hypothetical protein
MSCLVQHDDVAVLELGSAPIKKVIGEGRESVTKGVQHKTRRNRK